MIRFGHFTISDDFISSKAGIGVVLDRNLRKESFEMKYE